jgi:hypothetical protein
MSVVPRARVPRWPRRNQRHRRDRHARHAVWLHGPEVGAEVKVALTRLEVLTKCRSEGLQTDHAVARTCGDNLIMPSLQHIDYSQPPDVYPNHEMRIAQCSMDGSNSYSPWRGFAGVQACVLDIAQVPRSTLNRRSEFNAEWRRCGLYHPSRNSKTAISAGSIRLLFP